MPISRRLRFEILRRDGHTCRYCGAKAPDVALTVDHVTPTALGGGDDPSNLVTACQPCNAGKSSIAPGSPLVAEVETDALRWKLAIEQATVLRRLDREVIDEEIDEFDREWRCWRTSTEAEVPRSGNWRASTERFLAQGLTVEEMLRLLPVAMLAVGSDSAWRYFCGCCWRAITDLQETARELIESGSVVHPDGTRFD